MSIVVHVFGAPAQKQARLFGRGQRGRELLAVVALKGQGEVRRVLIEPPFGFRAASKQPFKAKLRDQQRADTQAIFIDTSERDLCNLRPTLCFDARPLERRDGVWREHDPGDRAFEGFELMWGHAALLM